MCLQRAASETTGQSRPLCGLAHGPLLFGECRTAARCWGAPREGAGRPDWTELRAWPRWSWTQPHAAGSVAVVLGSAPPAPTTQGLSPGPLTPALNSARGAVTRGCAGPRLARCTQGCEYSVRPPPVSLPSPRWAGHSTRAAGSPSSLTGRALALGICAVAFRVAPRTPNPRRTELLS